MSAEHPNSSLNARIDYVKLGKEYRREIVQMLVDAGRGHVGSAFSVIEILNVLFERVLKYDANNPEMPDRDRLILSKGHGCLGLYPILAKKGFFPRQELKLFCRAEGILGGHPDHRKIPGIETSTGSLGHGLSVGIGMALAARMNKTNKKKYRVFVVLGDGECNEGSIWEGALSAAKHGLDNLVVLVDYNKMQSYDMAEKVLSLAPFAPKWTSFGFETREVNMDDPHELEELLLSKSLYNGKPIAIICHTIKGKGVSFVENNPAWHHKNKLTDEELKGLDEALRD